MRGSGEPPLDSDQLLLDLRYEAPWEGRSPRALTRGFFHVILKREEAVPMRFPADPEQFDLW